MIVQSSNCLWIALVVVLLVGLSSLPQSMAYYLSQVQGLQRHYYHHHRHHCFETSSPSSSTTTITITTTTATTTTALFGRRKNNNSPRRRQKSDDVLAVEKELVERGFHPIIGSDESGRGSIAGPVIAASCCILQDLNYDGGGNNNNVYAPIPGVGDSKTLTPEERERIYQQVIDQPDVYAWEVALRSNTDIDDSNILIATMECFAESIENLSKSSNFPKMTTTTTNENDDNDNGPPSNPYSIVDGKKGPKLAVDIPSRPWVKGDAEVYTVGLASIIAKVTLDKLALEWHADYPDYGFDVHKGYATKEHIEMIHKHGPCPLHRMSFKSLKGR